MNLCNKVTLINELATMFATDQAMRKTWLAGAPWDDTIDRKHTARMKEIIAQIGWPRISTFGEDACTHAWLLVQHADHDVAFQRECLVLMEALPAEEVRPSNLAFLTDRVLMNEGMPQIYGSQLRKNAEGKYEPYDLEEPEGVDARRRAMGLEVLAEYVKGAKGSLP